MLDNGYNDSNYLLIQEQDLEHFIIKVGIRRQIIECIQGLRAITDSQCLQIDASQCVVNAIDVVSNPESSIIQNKGLFKRKQVIKFGLEGTQEYVQKKEWPLLQDFELPKFRESLEKKLNTNVLLSFEDEKYITNSLFDMIFEYFSPSVPLFVLQFVTYALCSKYESLDYFSYLRKLKSKFKNHKHYTTKGNKLKVKPKASILPKNLVKPNVPIKLITKTTVDRIPEEEFIETVDNVVMNQITNESSTKTTTRKRSRRIKNSVNEKQRKTVSLISDQIKDVGGHTNLSSLLKDNKHLLTIEGFLKELQANIAVNNYSVYDPNNDYFEYFTTNGVTAYERLTRLTEPKYRKITAKYKRDFNKMSDYFKTTSAVLMIQEILKIPPIVVTKDNEKSHNSKTFVLINTLCDIEEIIPCIESLKAFFIVDGNTFFELDVTKSIYYAFMSHFAFSLEYDDKTKNFWLSIEKIFMKWNISELNTDVKNLCNALCIK